MVCDLSQFPSHSSGQVWFCDSSSGHRCVSLVWSDLEMPNLFVSVCLRSWIAAIEIHILVCHDSGAQQRFDAE